MKTEVVLATADAVVREAQRRSRGEPPDRRFDIVLLMIEDLSDELAAHPAPMPPCDCGGRHSAYVDDVSPGAGHAVTCPVRLAYPYRRA